MIFRFFKRGFDVVSASILLVVISPVFLLLMILVRVKLGSPIFFKQERSGMHCKSFYIRKFRSMTDERDGSGALLPDEKRLTEFGRLLRSSSLDELPELFSIIKGDMSVIGPRPLPPAYNAYFTEREMKRFDVRSGLIPPDSVDPSAIISWNKQLEYEADYSETLSLKKDIRIFLGVFKIVFQRERTDYGAFVRLPLNEERKKEMQVECLDSANE